VERFHSVLATLATSTSVNPPPELAGKLTTMAQASRAPGVPTGAWAAADITALESARRSAERYCQFLADLPSSEWLTPCPPYDGWAVRDLVAHVVAVQRQFATELGLGGIERLPAAGASDHVAFTLPVVAELASVAVNDLRALAIGTAQQLFAGLEVFDVDELRHRRITLVGAPTTSVNTSLVIGTFELWTHTEDIAAATGRPAPGLDPEQLRLLCDLAVGVIPLGVLLMGRTPRPAQVRIVLTGPGGGAWTTALGSEPGELEALMVADARSFCRVAARRLSPEQLGASVSGDASLIDDVLAGVAVFAA
jgi:uncharacterized protein (TIGR03083 family)